MTRAGFHLGAMPRHWARRIRDVMTTAVVTAEESTQDKEIARLLTENRVSAPPLLPGGRHVAGIVTGAGLLAYQDKRPWEQAAVPGYGLRSQQDRALAAGELMSSPAVTFAGGTESGAAWPPSESS
jgi:CBS-domain-containing membrane protein